MPAQHRRQITMQRSAQPFKRLSARFRSLDKRTDALSRIAVSEMPLQNGYAAGRLPLGMEIADNLWDRHLRIQQQPVVASREDPPALCCQPRRECLDRLPLCNKGQIGCQQRIQRITSAQRRLAARRRVIQRTGNLKPQLPQHWGAPSDV